jgi:hypothetical protein
MGAHIAYNPTTCSTRSGFSIETAGTVRKAELPDGVTGPLYEYYLGYVPAYGYGDNDYMNPSPLSFPE